MTLMVLFGVLLVVSGLVNLAMPGTPVMEWVQAVLAAGHIPSQWMGSYASTAGAAWISWICGEPMQAADSGPRSICGPATTEYMPTEQTSKGLLEVYLRTRVLRCGCGFQMEIPNGT